MKQTLGSILEFVSSVVISVIIIEILKYYLKLDTYQSIVLCIIFILCLLAIKMDFRASTNLKTSEKIANQQIILPEILNHVKDIVDQKANIYNYEKKIQKISEGLRFIASKYSGKNLFFG